jgi:elongation factor P
MLKITDAKRGMIVRLENEYYQITKYIHTTPGKGQAIHHVYLKHLLTARQKELRLNTGDALDNVLLDNKPCQYLYRDATGHVFMDVETYDQFHLQDAIVDEALRFIGEGDTVVVRCIEQEPLYIELPVSVVLEVIEAEDVVKGDTATNLQKTIKVNTGYELKAPAHIKVGDKIKISTEDGLYSARAN